MDCRVDEALIKKECLHPGTKYIPLTEGTKVTFHFMTTRCDTKVVIDDSRKWEKPMVLVLGKKFKLEVWEVIVQKMSLNEVARFVCDKSLVQQYPFVSKTIRDSHKHPEERKHCCGMTLQNEGIGYKDLDELFQKPCSLEFTIEMLAIDLPENYEKESWQLSDDEKVSTIENYRIKGNEHFKDAQIDEAIESYSFAIGIAEQLMLKEKPNDIEWNDLAKLKIPLLLNFAQCMLIQRNYYRVMECCAEVIKYDPDNLKAYYRRGKAHVGAWNAIDAEKDFKKCLELDPLLKKSIDKELDSLNVKMKEHDDENKSKYKNLF